EPSLNQLVLFIFFFFLLFFCSSQIKQSSYDIITVLLHFLILRWTKCYQKQHLHQYDYTLILQQSAGLITNTFHFSVFLSECQSSVALQVLTSRCQGKKSCLVRASTRDFGDPCYAGTRKYLSVIYTCGESPLCL
uniref:SUEL-type lectin domain-containing protein n=1 Tax=Stegastes partitus TaxID=144197 RepID=A0A3B5B5S8_9TELE